MFGFGWVCWVALFIHAMLGGDKKPSCVHRPEGSVVGGGVRFMVKAVDLALFVLLGLAWLA